MSDCSTNAFKVPEGMCSCNRSRGYDELLQRHQQLQQVARKMHSALVFCAGGCYIGCPMLNAGCDVASGALRNQLEALGVGVDD